MRYKDYFNKNVFYTKLYVHTIPALLSLKKSELDYFLRLLQYSGFDSCILDNEYKNDSYLKLFRESMVSSLTEKGFIATFINKRTEEKYIAINPFIVGSTYWNMNDEEVIIKHFENTELTKKYYNKESRYQIE